MSGNSLERKFDKGSQDPIGGSIVNSDVFSYNSATGLGGLDNAFNNNRNAAYGDIEQEDYGYVDVCGSARDCGVDHNCVGGVCVPAEQTGGSVSGPGFSSGGSSYGSGSVCGDEAQNTDDCDDQGCNKGPTCGSGQPDPQKPDCCGKPVYRCANGIAQCEPCDDDELDDDEPFQDCFTSRDCPAGSFCSGGRCKPGCDSLTTCPGGSSCNFTNTGGLCEPDEEDCRSPGAAPCPVGYACRNNGMCSEQNAGCSLFCDSAFKAFGVPSAGCNTGKGKRRDCGHCKECRAQGGSCQEMSFGKPCWCSSGNSACGECQDCMRDNSTASDGTSAGFHSGSCLDRQGYCHETCSCKVRCPCGFTVKGSTSHDYFSGRTCKEKCRDELYEWHCVRNNPYKGVTPCPPKPPENPCDKSLKEPCEESCKCTNRYTNCGESAPCPDGKRCQGMGTVTLRTNGHGQCLDSTYVDGQFIRGGLLHFQRECIMSTDPKCDECDCNCENDCPDCYICNGEGKCEYDPDCDEPCEKPCDNKQCCGATETCQPGVIWKIVDACHYNGGTVVVPASVKLSLQHTANIPADQAVCDRFHTHCNVVGSNGKVYGTHLDCQRGLKMVGAAGYNVCG